MALISGIKLKGILSYNYNRFTLSSLLQDLIKSQVYSPVLSQFCPYVRPRVTASISRINLGKYGGPNPLCLSALVPEIQIMNDLIQNMRLDSVPT